MVRNMDLSPMNLQVMIPKSTEVGQMQHKLNHDGVVQQDIGALKLQQDADLKQKQVRTRDKMEDGKVKDEAKGQQGQGGQQPPHHPAENEETQAPMAVDSVRGRIVDIKL